MVSPKVASAKNLKKQGDGRAAEKFSSAQLSKVAHEDLDEFDELDDADSRANDVAYLTKLNEQIIVASEHVRKAQLFDHSKLN